jgi:hypothetical protein
VLTIFRFRLDRRRRVCDDRSFKERKKNVNEERESKRAGVVCSERSHLTLASDKGV